MAIKSQVINATKLHSSTKFKQKSEQTEINRTKKNRLPPRFFFQTRKLEIEKSYNRGENHAIGNCKKRYLTPKQQIFPLPLAKKR